MRQENYQGYYTAGETRRKLGNITEGQLYAYIRRGTLKKYVPPGKRYGVYAIADVEALAAARHAFSAQPPSAEVSSWELARDEDMDAIVTMSRAIFGAGGATVETRLTWLRANRETFWVVRAASGVIVGYASVLPLRRETIDAFIHDRIASDDITADDLQPFTPGRPLWLYLMAIGISPIYQGRKKREYGSRLLAGLFSFLEDLARRGVRIDTIVARSHTYDGKKLLRKVGIPQIPSPVEGKALFQVRPSESGSQHFQHYNAILAQAIPSHISHATRPATASTSPNSRNPVKATTTTSTLPPGLVGYREFARIHGIPVTTAQKSVETGRLPIVEGAWIVGRASVKGALDQDGRQAFYSLYHTSEKFTACPECPHEVK